MILGAVAILSATALIVQYRHHVFKGIALEERVKALEARADMSFDQKAFADLQSKVEALRIANGLRGSR